MQGNIEKAIKHLTREIRSQRLMCRTEEREPCQNPDASDDQIDRTKSRARKLTEIREALEQLMYSDHREYPDQ